MTVFLWLFCLIIAQRLFELMLAKQHERVMKEAGAIEFGAWHYKWVVTLHVSFFISLFVEVLLLAPGLTVAWLPLVVFLMAQLLRIWTIFSLGQYWNTKIIVLPGAKLVSKGPYKWIKHPNYLIVAVEIASFPLIFHAYFTAILFTMLNGVVMFIRIPEEEKALLQIENKH